MAGFTFNRQVLTKTAPPWTNRPAKPDPIIEPTSQQPIPGGGMSGVIPRTGEIHHTASGIWDVIKGGIDLATDIIPGQLDNRLADLAIGGIDRLTGRGLSSGCGPGMKPGVFGGCVPEAFGGGDPTPGVQTPAEMSVSTNGAGFRAPMRQATERLVCPPAPNGSSMVLYYSPETGAQVCLPRVGGAAVAKAYGLLRKWKPRAKPVLSAHDKKMMSKYGPGGSKSKAIKGVAQDAGFKCTKK